MDFRYPADGSVLDVPEFDVPEGARMVVTGPNGAGKTTLLRAMAGHLGDAGLGRPVAYLPQQPYLFRGLVGWNLGLGLDSELSGRAGALARRLGMGDRLTDPARFLSGGERARIALARTLAMSAEWVLLDEPLAAIDVADRFDVARTIVDGVGERTAVIVVHDLIDAVAMGTHLAVMTGGTMLQVGAIHDVLAHPSSVEVAAAIGVANMLEATVVGVDDGGVQCSIGAGLEILGTGSASPGDRVRVLFPAEVVTIFGPETTGVGSARNRWEGKITSLESVGRLIEVTVDVGVEVVATVTPGSVEGLGLSPGVGVAVAIKATSVRVVVT